MTTPKSPLCFHTLAKTFLRKPFRLTHIPKTPGYGSASDIMLRTDSVLNLRLSSANHEDASNQQLPQSTAPARSSFKLKSYSFRALRTLWKTPGYTPSPDFGTQAESSRQRASLCESSLGGSGFCWSGVCWSNLCGSRLQPRHKSSRIAAALAADSSFLHLRYESLIDQSLV
jgi:hypothetical protein